MLCRQELHHPSSEKERKPTYKLNQQLEELRNLQDKLTQEKQQWQRERDAEKKELEDSRQQLYKLQVQRMACFPKSYVSSGRHYLKYLFFYIKYCYLYVEIAK